MNPVVSLRVYSVETCPPILIVASVILLVTSVIFLVKKKITVARPELAPAMDIVASIFVLLFHVISRDILVYCISIIAYPIDSRIISFITLLINIVICALMVPWMSDIIVIVGPYSSRKMITLMQHLHSNATFLLVRIGAKSPDGYVIFSYQMDEEIGFCSRECPICLMEYDTEDECALLDKCGHTFHHVCLHKCLVVSTRCPLCRQNITDCAQK